MDTATISKYVYSVNSLNQRTNVAHTGTAFAAARDIAWGYDPLGQVTSANSTENTHDRAYQYDTIGNRQKSADSLTLPGTDNYTTNALNQYSAITGQPAERTLDDDGNLTSGTIPADLTANSTLVWDAENRLVKITKPDGDVIDYDYDYMSRRISKKVTGTEAKITVYDSWNPIAEYQLLNSNFTLLTSFTWGLDLSGSLQGAGGVGGLLAVTDSTGSYFPTFDGNGNVSEYLNNQGEVAAHYEYDPFGKTTIATGTKANDFTHRFSTKALDAESGLYYYGHRWYDARNGRWMSRDPIGENFETEEINEYTFVRNQSIDMIDVLGLYAHPLSTDQHGEGLLMMQNALNGLSRAAPTVSGATGISIAVKEALDLYNAPKDLENPKPKPIPLDFGYDIKEDEEKKCKCHVLMRQRFRRHIVCCYC